MIDMFGSGWVAAKDHGPLGSADDTATIQSALDAAGIAGGTVFLPAGAFPVRTLRWPAGVSIVGAGREATILRSLAAEPLLMGPSGGTWVPGPLRSLRLDGAGVGTIGLHLHKAFQGEFGHLAIANFTLCGVYLAGCIYNHFEGVFVHDCELGVAGDRTTFDGTQSNLNTFTSCQFWNCRQWALTWFRSALISMRACAIERNGTAGQFTGGAALTEGCPNGEGVGYSFSDCWFEENQGGADVFVNDPAGKCRTVVNSTIVVIPKTQYGLCVLGWSHSNVIHLDASTIGGSSTISVITQGPLASLERVASWVASA